MNEVDILEDEIQYHKEERPIDEYSEEEYEAFIDGLKHVKSLFDGSFV